MSIGWLDELRKEEVRGGSLRIDVAIHEDSASAFLMELLEAERVGNNKLTIWLTSPGGSVYHAFAVYDAIQNFRSRGGKVEIVAMGMAASAAAMIVLQAGDVRVAGVNTRFLLHEIRQITEENSVLSKSSVEDQGQEMASLNRMVLDVLSRRTGKDKSEIEGLFIRRERWLGVQEAKELGLIDKVLGDE